MSKMIPLVGEPYNFSEPRRLECWGTIEGLCVSQATCLNEQHRNDWSDYYAEGKTPQKQYWRQNDTL